MALNIKDRRTDELAREVAALSDKSITEALRETLELRVVELKAVRAARREKALAWLEDIQARAASTPDSDTRSQKEISDWLWDDSE